MAERLPDFPDLAGPAAEATQPPPFEQIVQRARRHRRRQVGGAAAATALVLAVAITGTTLTTGHEGSAPSPTRPSHTPTAPAPAPAPTPSPTALTAEQIIARGGVADFALDDRGDLLTVWSTCVYGSDGDQCDYAWKLSTPARTWTGSLPRNSGERVVPADGAFIVASWDQGGRVVGLDGSTQPLRRLDHGTFAAGSVVVASHREVGLAEAKTGMWFPLSGPGGATFGSGLVSGETIWAQERVPGSAGGARVAWRTVGGVWHEHTISGRGTTPGPVMASGDHVAATSGRVADDYNPLAVWSTSSDRGATWTDLPADQLPFGDADEMAATPAGTLYVHSLTDGLFRSTDESWRHFEKVPGQWLVNSLHEVPSGVAMLQWQRHEPRRIVVLDDAGRSTTLASFG